MKGCVEPKKLEKVSKKNTKRREGILSRGMVMWVWVRVRRGELATHHAGLRGWEGEEGPHRKIVRMIGHVERSRGDVAVFALITFLKLVIT